MAEEKIDDDDNADNGQHGSENPQEGEDEATTTGEGEVEEATTPQSTRTGPHGAAHRFVKGRGGSGKSGDGDCRSRRGKVVFGGGVKVVLGEGIDRDDGRLALGGGVDRDDSRLPVHGGVAGRLGKKQVRGASGRSGNDGRRNRRWRPVSGGEVDRDLGWSAASGGLWGNATLLGKAPIGSVGGLAAGGGRRENTTLIGAALIENSAALTTVSGGASAEDREAPEQRKMVKKLEDRSYEKKEGENWLKDGCLLSLLPVIEGPGLVFKAAGPIGFVDLKHPV